MESRTESPLSLFAQQLAPELGYGRQEIDAEDIEAVVRVLSGPHLTQGPAVARFESALEEATGARHAVAVANGTCALQLAYLALGIRSGSRLLTTANTFLATATAALHTGAEVDFVDIEPRGANLDVDLVEARLARGERIAVVAAVHFAGLPCAMERLIQLKRRHGFKLVEDAAHALGARYRVEGRLWRAGEHPEIDATCLSFHPVKHITTGEGGAVLTNDAGIAERVRALRSHGIDRTSQERPFGEDGPSPSWFAPMVALGFNYRLTDLQAALGTSQLTKLERFLARRRALARRYASSLTGFELPQVGDASSEHTWHLFWIRSPRRDSLMGFLRERGIGTQVHYYPVPYQPFFRARLGARRYPRAEAHARSALSLPLFPGLTDADQTRVIEALEAWQAR